jgi:hypothetical protein
MQRFFVQKILDKIAADLPQFKTVGLFNDDFNKYDEGLIDSFRFPALFVSFPDGADYLNQGGKLQKTTLTVRFFIADELTKSRLSISKTVLDVFDLKQAVFNVFSGFQQTATNETFSTFERVREETDEDRRNYYIFIQDYRTELIDPDTWVQQGTTHLLSNGLDINDEVVINPATKADNNGIRTAKDVNDG